MAAERRRVVRGDEVWIKIKPYRGDPVRGIVKDVLTRKFDHPRGIKVRLVDGRIGRIVDASRDDDAGIAFLGIVGIVGAALGAAWFAGKK